MSTLHAKPTSVEVLAQEFTRTLWECRSNRRVVLLNRQDDIQYERLGDVTLGSFVSEEFGGIEEPDRGDD